MPTSDDWKYYYDRTKDAPPHELLVKAVGFVQRKGKAIDIGSGALKDSRYLAAQGFDVTALDQEPVPPEIAATVDQDKIHFVTAAYADFDFPADTYDLASATYSLPFNPPTTFDQVFTSIKRSLRPGGIFSGQFFGVRDEWAPKKPDMTFHTRTQVDALLADMEIIMLEEKEWNGTLTNGTPKHWHVWNIIARKK